LDYLDDLGVTALWLSPVHPSPGVDLGYDVTDYTTVDPRLGSIEEFDALVASAHRCGIAVFMDWVINHTSDAHPWFVDAIASPTSPHRDWYVFRRSRRGQAPPTNWRAMFGGSAWQQDDGSEEWYLHTFFPQQPDLNWRNHAVQDAVAEAMRFWLRRGVDGFRLDSLPMLVKDDRFRDNPVDPRWQAGRPDYWQLRPERTVDQPDLVEILHLLRAVVDEYPDRLLIGELGLPPARMARYFADIQIPLNFGLVTSRWTAERIGRRIQAHLDGLPAGAWPNWVLGNHDVPRVATRLGPSLARAAAVVLLTLPGTVTIYYGDELGMTDAPSTMPSRDRLGQLDAARSRDPQRAPMPWDANANAGFSTGQPWLPVHPDAARLSVTAQTADPQSTLSLHRALLRLRAEHAELAHGPFEQLRWTDNVLSYRTGRFHIHANLSDQPADPPGPSRARVVVSSDPTVVRGARADRAPLQAQHAIVVDCN
jgi:alpha-glucosidase